MNSKYYITTPIYYPSGLNPRFHIGTAYTTILTDSLNRYAKLRGKETHFLTGMDEHGQKVGDVSKERGLTPTEHVDEYAKMAKNLWSVLDVKYDDFIRTTETRHKDAVQKIFEQLLEQDDIYLSNYEGDYCKICESFVTKTQVDDQKSV